MGLTFEEVSNFLSDLENNSKQLNKIVLIRDFLRKNIYSEDKDLKKESILLLDIIIGNYQRNFGKKNLEISLKTMFSVLEKISNKPRKDVEKEFNKIGDIGKLFETLLKNKNNSLLFIKKTERIYFKDILKLFNDIVNLKGKNSNLLKIKLLIKIFSKLKTDNEKIYLSRLMINNLRIGVSEGLIKEAVLNTLFYPVIGINKFCQNCNFVNLNVDKCFKCDSKLNQKRDEEINYLKKQNYEIINLNKNFLNEKDKKKFNEIFKKLFYNNSFKKKVIFYENSGREIYNFLLHIIEKKYNTLNSFELFFKEVEKDNLNLLKENVYIGIPIKSMLGIRVKNIDEVFDNIKTKPILADFKYDGLRLQIHNKKGDVKLFSRNLDEITNQFKEVVNYVKENFNDVEFILDVECIAFDYENEKYIDFQKLSQRITSKENKTKFFVSVKAFDILFFNGESLINKKYKERRKILENLFINRELKQDINLFDIKKIILLKKNFDY